MVCIFCKNERPESEEHVFCEALGKPDVIVKFVCKSCNDRLGAEVDVLADRDARLTHARHHAGLPPRYQSIQNTAPATGASGEQLKTLFHKTEGASVVAPQRDGDDMMVGRDLMKSVLRDLMRAEFRKQKVDLTHEEVRTVTDEALKKYDEADIGATVRVEHRGATLSLEKLELENDVATASRHDVPGAINRVSAKIAFELAARELGPDFVLNDAFDEFRSWVLTGEPDLSNRVEVIRNPALEGGDAAKEHTVHLRKEENQLRAEIDYFDAYAVRVTIGPAPAHDINWARRFPL